MERNASPRLREFSQTGKDKVGAARKMVRGGVWHMASWQAALFCARSSCRSKDIQSAELLANGVNWFGKQVRTPGQKGLSSRHNPLLVAFSLSGTAVRGLGQLPVVSFFFRS